MKKKLLTTFAIIIIIVAATPWGLYAIGLLNVSGRPERALAPISNEEAEQIWRDLNETGPVQVARIVPWDYVLFFASGLSKEPSGMKALWIVARDYNTGRLKDKRIGSWHLSGAAVIIWLSRNWTTNEIISKVKEIQGRNIKET